jgi:hypothetical protein
MEGTVLKNEFQSQPGRYPEEKTGVIRLQADLDAGFSKQDKGRADVEIDLQ